MANGIRLFEVYFSVVQLFKRSRNDTAYIAFVKIASSWEKIWSSCKEIGKYKAGFEISSR